MKRRFVDGSTTCDTEEVVQIGSEPARLSRSRRMPASKTRARQIVRSSLRVRASPALWRIVAGLTGMLGFPVGVLGVLLGWWGQDGYLLVEGTSALSYFMALWPSIMDASLQRR